MIGSYDPALVALSVLVACLAGYVAIDISSRVAAAVSRRAARVWLSSGALALGCGIWSMHFIGMLAWRLPVAMSYDVAITSLSMLIATVVSGFALHTASDTTLGRGRLAGSAALMGCGIAAMHYTGMAAMQMQPPIRYSPGLFALSILIAIVASWAGLWLAFNLREDTRTRAAWRRAGSAVLIGAAISGMHYTGMAAALVAPDAVCTVPAQDIDNVWLAFGIAGFSGLLLGMTLLLSLFDARLAAQQRASDETYRLLWEATSDAVVLLDADGRIEFANSAVGAVFGYAVDDVIGRNIAMLQPAALRAAHADGVGRYLATGVKTMNWRGVETNGLHRDGHEFPVEIAFGHYERRGRACFAGFIRDISERRLAQNLIAGQKRILELIAAGEPLAVSLGAIIEWLEREFRPALGSVLVVDEDGKRLEPAAAPSLPAAFAAAIAGIAIGPDVGTCGAAAYRRETVVTPDIATDPHWAPLRGRALEHGLRACWSHPVVSPGGRLLGTIAMYRATPYQPGARELEALRTLAPVAGVAIERAQILDRMRVSNERYALASRATNDAIWDWDLVRGTLSWSDVYHEQFGYAPDARPPGIESWSDHIHAQDRTRVLSSIDAALASDATTWSEEYRYRKADGTHADVLDRGFISRDEDGRALRMIGAIMDISERKRTEAELAHLAQFDTLTGLPNRNLFKDRLEQAIVRAHRAGWSVALAFVDLDRFKEINDTLGHGAGDEVLKQAAARLRASVREGDTVARLGGDEFTIVLEDAGDVLTVAKRVQRILEILAEPIAVESRQLFVSASIGVSVYPSHGSTSEVLLQHADTAMYHAKKEGRNNVQFFAPAMGSAAAARMDLETSLRQALSRNELLLYYQPLVELATGAIVGAEALLRWQHPEWGLTAPGRFIDVAEHSGLIVPIGEWVLREACAQNAAWRRDGLPPIHVAVNISARQLRKVELLDVIVAALAASDLTGAALEIEITESLLMENPASSAALLARLKALGVRVALDDFGTGYSSLAYLKHFPLDTLKIDQSFVRDVTDGSDDGIIVKAMIGLAHNMLLDLVAEGVETPAQLAFLRAHGCDIGQGYLFSPPLPAARFSDLLAQGRCEV